MCTKEQLSTILSALNSDLIDRESTTRLVLLAALAGEHVLLVGPPGTAKSEIARRLRHIFKRPSYFERLLTRFSTPEELFGPISLRALEQDRFERRTEGYLPSVRVAFVDEIFKANSAILNSLLTLINERKFDNGAERVDAPLECLIGASNELPESAELGALYDRFLIRLYVGPLQREADFERLLDLTDASFDIPLEDRIQRGALDDFRRLSQQVKLPPDVSQLLVSLRAFLIEKEIYVSDRRWRKVVKLLKVAAWANEREEVSILDGWLLQHLLWNEPEQREVISRWYEDRLGVSDEEGSLANFAVVVDRFEKLLEKEQGQRVHLTDKEGAHLYEDPTGGRTTDGARYHKRNENDDLLYLAPRGNNEREACNEYTSNELIECFGFMDWNQGYVRENRKKLRVGDYTQNEANHVTVAPAAVLVAMHYSPEHIEGRLERVEDALGKLREHLQILEKHTDQAKELIEEDLWLPDAFAEKALEQLRQKTEHAKMFEARLEEVREGFSSLPREEANHG